MNARSSPMTRFSEPVDGARREVGTMDPAGLQQLLNTLRGRGYRTIAPTVRDGAIVYDEIAAIDELPVGMGDVQEPGTYRMVDRGDDAYFGYAVGAHSWKAFLYPPSMCLWRAIRLGDGFAVEEPERDHPKYALIGVRACELKAIALQDQIYLEGDHVDPDYRQRREDALIVAVNCSSPSAACFCTSFAAGPGLKQGYDLALTEILDEPHRFVVEAGTRRGAEILTDLPHRSATKTDLELAKRVVSKSTRRIRRRVETDNLPELLYKNLEDSEWDAVAERCLTCGNCTQVCPTCFCMTVDDVTDLTGDTAERRRRADSCFTGDFSYIYGGSVRASTRARYRQWLTHKMAGWVEQFGDFGCVGCGRCITWCPVGIDITEEVAKLRDDKPRAASDASSADSGDAGAAGKEPLRETL